MVSTEPSPAQEQIREESIATPEVADAAQSSAEEAAARDATAEVTAEVAAAAEQQTEPHHQFQTFAQQAQGLASSAAHTAQSAASSVAQTARSTFSNTQTRPPDFPPRGDHTQPSRIVYIGNLFFEVTAPQLEAEFARYGEITNSRVVTDSRGLSKGFAYVEFANQDAADRAVKELDQKVFQGRRMAVQYHIRREPRPLQGTEGRGYGGGGGSGGVGRLARPPNPPSKTLFIGNMSYQMSDRDLNDLFREIRNVLDVRVAIDRRSGQPRGFAHADFIDISSARVAKEHLEKKVVYGRQLKVDYSASSSSTQQSVGGSDE